MFGLVLGKFCGSPGSVADGVALRIPVWERRPGPRFSCPACPFDPIPAQTLTWTLTLGSTLCPFLTLQAKVEPSYLLPTAFRATFGSGSPVVAICAEYDRTPDRSLVLMHTRTPQP